MKVLHICMTQYSDGWTYQENMLSKYHKLAGHDVIIMTSLFCYDQGKMIEDSKRNFVDCNGCQVIRLEKRKGGLSAKLPSYKQFYETIVTVKPDIIFSHGCQYVDIKHVRKYIENNKNVILFVDNHADFSNSATNFLSKAILHKIIWRYYAHVIEPVTSKFWGVLPARVDFLTEVYTLPKEKCELLVMGGDDEMIEKSENEHGRYSIREKYNIHEDDFLIVTGGKIDSVKYQTLNLMRAVKEISNPKLKLLVFGSISEELQNKADEFTDGVLIQQVGWISPEESYNYFAAADLVVFPGRHSVFWEQVVAQGVPMIVKEWEGTHHVDVGGNVKFLSDDSVERIKDEILNLTNDPITYEKMKSVAKESGMKIFSYRTIAQRSIENQRR